MAAIKGEVSGTESVAVTGIATGNETTGVLTQADTVGVRAFGRDWIGVYGETQSTIGGAGVWGEHKSNGTGAVGKSNSGVGVFGESTTGPGVQGKSEGPGVIGTSTKWVGVYGETAGIQNGPAGVWGEHKGAGIGVKAISNTGVGLVAFSNGTAAVFQGNVEVTGSLNVQGVDVGILLKRIEELEKRLEHQQPLVGGLVGRPVGGLITVSESNNPRGLRGLHVAGSGFNPNFGAVIRVVTRFSVIGEFSLTTDSKGKFDGVIDFDFPSLPLAIAARDNRPDGFDLTGHLWSNTVVIPHSQHFP